MSYSNNNVTFLLGPTNTGKTYSAIERMMTFSSGIIGLPLRLLAREVYDKVIKKSSPLKVALVTGEEKIYPPQAKYIICTVESMPINKIVDFVAVDEIQLATDPDRGHIFTDRLLHSRGEIETIFMGSDTMTPIIKKLFPNPNITTLKRRSKLNYIGKKRLSNLPKRTAIIAFKISDVYGIAEYIKTIYGGAALVLGALSPQTRNSQVKMYEDGIVDYIVATDAIGMGLNLNIDHIALASRRKFDGKTSRNLRPDEIGQIAGRAGRNFNAGTFAETSDCFPLDPVTISSIELGQYESLNYLYWRSRNLNFNSISQFLKSIEQNSNHPQLIKVQNSDDEVVFRELIQIPYLKKYLNNYDSIKLLWEVSSIPDYQKNLDNSHINLLVSIYSYLVENQKLPIDWTMEETKKLQISIGTIDVLVSRLARIRIWNYISNRTSWVEDSFSLKNETLKTEKMLSNALHEKLTEAFVDNKISTINKYIKKNTPINLQISYSGIVNLNKIEVGIIKGLTFVLNVKNINVKRKDIKKFINKKVSFTLNTLAQEIHSSKDRCFEINNNGFIYFNNKPLFYLTKGESISKPSFKFEKDDLITSENYQLVLNKINYFIKKKSLACFSTFQDLKKSNLSSISKGICFRVEESSGVVPCNSIKKDLKIITQVEKLKLKELKIVFGKENIFLKDLRYSNYAKLRWILAHINEGYSLKPFPSGHIIKSIKSPKSAWNIVGYVVVKELAVDVESIEKVSMYLKKSHAKSKKFKIDYDKFTLFKVKPFELMTIISSLGYKKIAGTNKLSFWIRKHNYTAEATYNLNSPFSVLNKLQ